ncbi:hypothetical protein EDD66_104295 [Mobilisporobacter senegalensis]|uniref:Uncharacterized protein n=1 Tax=Mobilisporobacter senegalensis TaxID=1329262 RepID=A0A3N1XQ08_9FIRM|nr:DUF536 domain-containing protein [Mobilisporobacter senegalensis]ROR28706.1 hypothetical protein EDD66_104295 [Mobilisporobacter senegalensis]
MNKKFIALIIIVGIIIGIMGCGNKSTDNIKNKGNIKEQSISDLQKELEKQQELELKGDMKVVEEYHNKDEHGKDYLLFVIENTTNQDARVDVDVQFYNGDELIDEDYGVAGVVEKGHKTVIDFKDLDEFTKYTYTLETSKADVVGIDSLISESHTFIDNRAVLDIKNNSAYILDSSGVYGLFYKDGKFVCYTSDRFNEYSHFSIIESDVDFDECKLYYDLNVDADRIKDEAYKEEIKNKNPEGLDVIGEYIYPNYDGSASTCMLILENNMGEDTGAEVYMQIYDKNGALLGYSFNYIEVIGDGCKTTVKSSFDENAADFKYIIYKNPSGNFKPIEKMVTEKSSKIDESGNLLLDFDVNLGDYDFISRLEINVLFFKNNKLLESSMRYDDAVDKETVLESIYFSAPDDYDRYEVYYTGYCHVRDN